MLQADSLTECRAVSAVSTSHGSQQGAPQSARGLLRADRAKWRGANSCIIPIWTRHVLCQVSGQTPALFPAGHGRCRGKLLHYSQLDTARLMSGDGANSCIIPSWTRQVLCKVSALSNMGHFFSSKCSDNAFLSLSGNSVSVSLPESPDSLLCTTGDLVTGQGASQQPEGSVWQTAHCCPLVWL